MLSIYPGHTINNRLPLILNKPNHDFQRADLLKIIKQRKIDHITFHYIGLDGKLKELKLPFLRSYQAERILAEGERVDGSSLFKGLIDVTFSDLYVVPDYHTAFLNPFHQGSLDFICRYLTKDAALFPLSADNILNRAHQLFFQKNRSHLFASGELEFFLISKNDNNIYPLLTQQGYHESSPFSKSRVILDEMVYFINYITGMVKYSHSENGSVECICSERDEVQGKKAEQLEVEFASQPVVEMADSLVLARWLIRNIAYKHNCIATFTPKIEEGVAGNGFHIHLGIMKDGKNIMINSKSKLTENALGFIGGLCHYADSLTAFGNMVASSYLRLVPNQGAPTRIFWSDLNRSAMIRVPLAWTNSVNLAQVVNPHEKVNTELSGSTQSIELRTPDGSALIHLLLAGIVMAADWGLYNKNATDLAEKYYIKGNAAKDIKNMTKFPKLPSSCAESSRILLKKRDLYEREDIFPSILIDYIANLLRAENDNLLKQKLSGLSKEKYRLEIRKIMHKDMHLH